MTKKYVAPEPTKDSFTCPHCGTMSLMKHDIVYYRGAQAVSLNNFVSNKTSYVQISSCINCSKKTIWIDGVYIYPDIVAEEANADMPEAVKQLYTEAGLIYNKSPRAACALLRLAVDRLCNELGENDKDINKNIGALVEKGLPRSVQQALDIVRVVGNKAVHPGQIAFNVDDKKTAITLMKLVNMITERMITEPKEINSMFEELPNTVKDSIEKRDN